MRPERAAALLLAACLLLWAIVPAAAGAGGPPDHAGASGTAIDAAAKTPNEDKNPNSGRNNGKGGGTPEPTPSALPSPEVTPTGVATPIETAAPTPTATVAETGRDDFPWTAVLLALLLAGGGAAFGIYVKRPHDEAAAATTVLPDAHRTLPPLHPPGFPAELAGRYDRVAFVGRGGLGQVFSAVRREDGRTVAVKVPVSYDEATGKTFMREMRLQEDLVHENIVQVYSVNILPVPFVEMEYLPRSLEDLEKPVPIKTAVRIAAGIAAGLAYAHERGVVHRDIKPRNILLDDGRVPKIADWGTGTRPAETIGTGAAGFTLAYAAPEQIAPERFGKTGPRTDVYQLGAVLYEMATGRLPSAGEGLAGLALAIRNAEPVPPSTIDPALAGLDPIVLRCLAKDPADRYGSAGEVLCAIETLMREAGEKGA